MNMMVPPTQPRTLVRTKAKASEDVLETREEQIKIEKNVWLGDVKQKVDQLSLAGGL
jgi:hypothetical protein